MQSPTDPADRAGIGVEAFDATYEAGFQASDDSPHAVECELVRTDGLRLARPGRLEAVVEGLARPVVRRDVVPLAPFSWSRSHPRLPCRK